MRIRGVDGVVSNDQRLEFESMRLRCLGNCGTEIKSIVEALRKWLTLSIRPPANALDKSTYTRYSIGGWSNLKTVRPGERKGDFVGAYIRRLYLSEKIVEVSINRK
jgi:hypothetical protein